MGRGLLSKTICIIKCSLLILYYPLSSHHPIIPSSYHPLSRLISFPLISSYLMKSNQECTEQGTFQKEDTQEERDTQQQVSQPSSNMFHHKNIFYFFTLRSWVRIPASATFFFLLKNSFTFTILICLFYNNLHVTSFCFLLLL